VSKEALVHARERANADRYSQIAPFYKEDWRGQVTHELKEEFERFLAYLGEPPGEILDAGCGTGKAAVYFAQKGYEVTGLDLSIGMLEEARRQDAGNGEFNPVIGNMRVLPFSDKAFRGVWCMAALVHLDKKGKQRAIQEYSRVLEPGGYLYISVQNLLSKKHLRRVWQSAWSYLGYDDQNQFYIRPKSLDQIISGSSLIERVRNGYAFLDDRHWFYPTKSGLIGLLQKQGFSIIDSNQAFERRLRIFAKK
jgi:ubiquinone/menaquinone biosynthesis C-methylase UbiE